MKKVSDIITRAIWLIAFSTQFVCIIELFGQTFDRQHIEIITTFIICEIICNVISQFKKDCSFGLFMFILDFYYRQRKADEELKKIKKY